MAVDNLPYFVGISAIPEIGAVRFKKIVDNFDPISDFFRCRAADLTAIGIPQSAAEKIIASREALDLDRLWQNTQEQGVKLLTYTDSAYPALLLEIYDYPPLLYYRGDLSCLARSTVAVVGTRKMSYYGQEMTQALVSGLVSSGITIVSGLARGIDSVAHHATLQEQGLTAAVLGTGLDWRSFYPRENVPLAERMIAQGGLLLSEFPCGMPGNKENFPRRNRLISGLSLGTVVVEAGVQSGALITARLALDQNREVFAVPGNIHTPVSAGPHQLLKAGAHLVTQASDILEVLDLTSSIKHATIAQVVADNPAEAAVLALLSKEPRAIDEVMRVSGLAGSRVSATLTILEVAGKVRDVGGKNYILA
ncbi:DNA-protecting protein DprA [Candidatus Falkowbacteria bacterium]|nr:DNA-protecting protein DprA [Candidatus Falkowbacteria bacterium]